MQGRRGRRNSGFQYGADDYIKKPYNSAVLLARIARLLKKNNAVSTLRGLTLDCTAHEVRYGGKTVSLTKNEMRIIHFLMRKPLCGKDEIIENLWFDSCYIDENTLYVNINRIREKLKEIGAENFLQTVCGRTYFRARKRGRRGIL